MGVLKDLFTAFKKNSFWSPWKYRVHRRSGGELWSGAGAPGSHTGEDTQGPIIFIMSSIRPSRQSAVFLEVRAHRLKIYSKPWLRSDKQGTKSNSTCCFSPFCFSIWGDIKNYHQSQHESLKKGNPDTQKKKNDLQNSQFISYTTKTTMWMFTGTHYLKCSVMGERRRDVPYERWGDFTYVQVCMSAVFKPNIFQ